MQAGSVKEHKESVTSIAGMKLLPVAVLYGANSSGKSNVLRALAKMLFMIVQSVKLNPGDGLSFEPFLLNEVSKNEPTSFEIEFLKDKIKYRYGFEYDRVHICKEWLYEKRPLEREYNLFLRLGNDFNISKMRFSEGLGKEDATASNRLFISLVAQLNGEKARDILEQFKRYNILSGLNSEGYEGFTLTMFSERLDGWEEALDFFRKINLGFNNLIVREKPMSEDMLEKIERLRELMKLNLKDTMKEQTMVEELTIHTIYGHDGKRVGEQAFNEEEMESEGTKKIIEMSGPIFDTLRNGKLLAIDELDAKLHPFLTRSVVQLFMNPETNPKGAQLIFATHDTHLLNTQYLRRDQIWFTEKDETESSDLYSLLEFRDDSGNRVRNDRDIENDYIKGRYGAIPFIH